MWASSGCKASHVVLVTGCRSTYCARVLVCHVRSQMKERVALNFITGSVRLPGGDKGNSVSLM